MPEFEINDRSTWDWTVTGAPLESWADEDGFIVNPDGPGFFYQFGDGAPYKISCPADQHFNPLANLGPVCCWPEKANSDSAKLYEWAVCKRFVRDQR